MKVAFIGHRNIECTQELKDRLTDEVERLIANGSVDTFIFGSKSEFDDLCYEIVTKLRERYSHIKRIYVRGEYEYIDNSYYKYLLTMYEETFFPQSVHGAGVLSYIMRNKAMIDMCDILIAYFDKNYIPSTTTKSGTMRAVYYAESKKKTVINIFESI